ncbi:MAG: hypothetical protein P4L91_09345 [Burkholderiaceae bacterium]|nr:hypothetical protein [Burkholderiaceae bacterium]
MQSKRFASFMIAVPLACLSALAGCGGGGSSSSSSSTTTTTIVSTTNVVVTGVAAIGAPLGNATISVVDGNGAAVKLLNSAGNTVTTATTNVADGSYTLTLNTASPKLPLFIEAVGSDATGWPVVLHTVVQSDTAPVVANITPLTNAVVAEILGADPQGIFLNASANASAIAALGNTTSLSTAMMQIETIIAKNLTDAKVTSSTSLNLFKDPTFTTNKTLVDAVLEGLRIQIVKDSSGNDQLQLSNKFAAIGSPEVKISLATAKAQLALGSSGKIASAITSTTITTTSPTTVIANIATLDNLTIAINTLIAQRVAATGFASLASAVPAPPSPALASIASDTYAYNGRTFAQLEQVLEGYATNNYQLSALQVTGCIDDPVPAKGCTNLAVAAVVTDVNGNVVDLFSDGVAYSKTTTPTWKFSGNGRYASVAVYPVAYASFSLGGSLTTGTTGSNPSTGLQVAIQAQDSSGTETVGNSAVLLASDQSIPFAYCSGNLLCLWQTPSVLPTATGDLSDTLLQAPALGWLGSVDAVIGAKYVITYASWITVTNQSANAYLPANLPTNLATSLFPAVDGVTASAPLTGATITAGFTLSWANWAAANPNMKVFMVRTVISSTGASPVITDNTVPFGNATSVAVAASTLPAGYVPTAYEVWIGAVDSLGHRYFTQLIGSS